MQQAERNLHAVTAENKSLREALQKIASCDVRWPGDVVDIARRAMETVPNFAHPQKQENSYAD